MNTPTFPQHFAGGDALHEYVSRYRRSDLPELEVGNPLDLFPEEPISCDFVPELTWEHEWPFNNRSGVYLIYSDKQDLLYIGQAHRLGKRLYDYFGGGKVCRLRHETWPQRPRFVINIAVPDDMAWEKAGLESFLIQKLQPFCNVIGR